MRERSVNQLSGGERSRVSLALGLGFAELAAARGRLTPNLLVLDEVSQPWSRQGRPLKGN
jgi:DNA repair exonuclease SbcCD ATPase subunit